MLVVYTTYLAVSLSKVIFLIEMAVLENRSRHDVGGEKHVSVVEIHYCLSLCLFHVQYALHGHDHDLLLDHVQYSAGVSLREHLRHCFLHRQWEDFSAFLRHLYHL